MGKRVGSIFGQLAFLFPLIAGLSTPAFAGCSPSVVTIKGDFGKARFNIEVADDEDERAQGLMFRESLPNAAGMLFVYESPRSVAFWMRNTLIPLDMLFVDSTGTIARIHENAIPLDETPIPGGDNILAVLEINGGLSRRLGLEVGDVLRHEAFDQRSAVWPCGK
ncbi:DUF192 domain-containing protein [Actibacterium pelagium]|uniref:DUF192 domain-containing protein n=1 Tax=Actibacterium pelagium TaxID=2029103 RepID=A0A917ACP9_9RHOB|nr:DUF192 domain-containing protein [Actibacterium pelagium]GGE41852.1 hypothetical protein GCM10011517_06820 [Actibacterium pelagium]